MQDQEKSDPYFLRKIHLKRLCQSLEKYVSIEKIIYCLINLTKLL